MANKFCPTLPLGPIHKGCPRKTGRVFQKVHRYNRPATPSSLSLPDLTQAHQHSMSTTPDDENHQATTQVNENFNGTNNEIKQQYMETEVDSVQQMLNEYIEPKVDPINISDMTKNIDTPNKENESS